MKHDEEKLCLGIETSCDDTALALYSSKGYLIDNLLSSQVNAHNREKSNGWKKEKKVR